MVFVDVRGDASTGRDVVMLHGLPTAPATMWHVGDALTDLARVLNVHLPGYDRSAPLRPFVEEQALVLIEEALAKLKVQRPIFIGFSGGAFRAFELALRADKNGLDARGLVALGGLHALPPALREGLRASAELARTPGLDLKKMFAPHFLSPTGMKNPAWVAEVHSWFDVARLDDVANELVAFASLPDLDLSTLTIPMLARVGDVDLATPPALTDAIARAAPHCEMQLVPGAGHAIMLEDEAATRAAVRTFVQSL